VQCKGKLAVGGKRTGSTKKKKQKKKKKKKGSNEKRKPEMNCQLPKPTEVGKGGDTPKKNQNLSPTTGERR